MKQSSLFRWVVGGLALLLIVALSLVWKGYPRLFELSWDEEVRLHDGRIVVVGRSIQYERLDRWSRYQHAFPRKETLRFVPESESQPRQVSFPNLRLLVFDVHAGVNYLVLTSTSGRSEMPERSPFPVGEGQGNYRALRWNGDRFVQIPLQELPSAIVARNISWTDAASDMVAYQGRPLSVPEKELIKSQVLRPDRSQREIVR